MLKLLHSNKIWFGIILLLIANIIFIKILELHLIPVLHVDGTYQTASALYRIKNGEWFGVDFLSYLGIGPILLLFPLFILFGGDIYASLLSSHIMVFSSTFALIAILCFFIGRKHFKLLFSVMTVLLVIGFFFRGGDLNYFYTPGNSLKPIRSFLPYLAFVFYFVLNKYLVSNGKLSEHHPMTVAAVLSIIIIWSNDYALPTFALLTCLVFLLNFKIFHKSPFVFLKYFAYCTTFPVLSLWLFNGGALLPYLGYNFQDVAQDQWWYFTSYQKDERVYNFSDLSLIFSSLYWRTYFCFAVLIIFYWKTRHQGILYVLFIGLVHFLAASLSIIGGHLSYTYLIALNSWAYFVLIIGGISFFYSYLKQSKILDKIVSYVTVVSLVLVATVITVTSVLFYQNSESLYDDSDVDWVEVKLLGGKVDTRYDTFLNDVQQLPKDSVVLEEYWGLASAIRDTSNLWKLDAVIHLLGKQRQEAKESLNSADYFLSTNFTFNEWARWSFSMNYWLFKELLERWNISNIYPNLYLWKNGETSLIKNPVSCIIENTNNHQSFTIEANKKSIVEVTLEYDFSYEGRGLITLDNKISHVFMALDPKARKVTFPVFVLKEATAFPMNAYSSGKNDLKLTSCEAWEIEHDYLDLLKLYLLELGDQYLYKSLRE